MQSVGSADCIFYGTNIITMDEECPSAQALATKDGKIIAVGRKEDVFPLGAANTKYIALNESQTLLPGFIEAHQHAIHMTIARCLFIDCSAYYYQSYRQIKDLIDKTVANMDPSCNKWCIFDGWDPELVGDLPDLNWEILDGFSRDIPIMIFGQNHHIGWANRKAFEKAGVDENTKDPEGGYFERDPETKKLTGKLMEPAAFLRLSNCAPAPTYKKWKKAVDDQWQQYVGCGFTTVTDLLFFRNWYDFLDEAIENKTLEPDCPIRLALYEYIDSVEESPVIGESPSPGESPSSRVSPSKRMQQSFKSENDKLWFPGVKIVSDGSPHCGTVAAREPFLENKLTRTLGFPPSPNYGKLNFNEEQLYKMVKHWHDKGKQVAIHAHGERAIEQVLGVYEQILTGPADLDRRHRIEHLGLAEETHIKRASKLNLSLSFFVAHLYFYGKIYTESILGEKRTNRWTPLSLASKHGLRWTVHQDNPAFPGPPEPFANLQTAITRTRKGDPSKVYGEEYCVSIHDALQAYTINAAWQIHKEKELGSLTVGKRADLVILSDNPLKVDPFKLVDIKVLDTYLDGRSNGITERKESIQDGTKFVYSYV